MRLPTWTSILVPVFVLARLEAVSDPEAGCSPLKDGYRLGLIIARLMIVLCSSRNSTGLLVFAANQHLVAERELMLSGKEVSSQRVRAYRIRRGSVIGNVLAAAIWCIWGRERMDR